MCGACVVRPLDRARVVRLVRPMRDDVNKANYRSIWVVKSDITPWIQCRAAVHAAQRV